MANPDYDLVIIGGGPAGLTAGLYAARARLNAVMLEKLMPGGQVMITDWVENYPGFPEGITGAELMMKMIEQAEKFGLKTIAQEVVSLDFSGDFKKLITDSGEITTKSVIIATGASPKRLGAPGEDEFYGKGVSFCATCDAPFYRDSMVAAVGGGDTAVQESLFLTKFAKKVYLIHRRDELRASKILQERAFANDKIEIVWDSVLASVNGSKEVESVTVKNVKTDETKDLDVEGCFIFTGIKPNNEFVKDALATDEWGFIITDSKMETNVPGVFAVGDARNTPLRQIATATGDAAIATVSAEHYLDNFKK